MFSMRRTVFQAVRMPLCAVGLAQQLDEAWQRLVRRIAGRSGVEIAKRINGGKPPVDFIAVDYD